MTNNYVYGAHRHTDKGATLDYYPTPPFATRALLERLSEESRIPLSTQTAYDPCCGEGHMSNVLCEYFRSVESTDYNDYGYAGQTLKHDATTPLPYPADWIITNPPYNLLNEVMDNLLKHSSNVCLLVKSNALETIGRYKIYQDFPPDSIYQFSKRVGMFKGYVDSDKGSTVSYMWLVWINKVKKAPQFFWIKPDVNSELKKDNDDDTPSKRHDYTDS